MYCNKCGSQVSNDAKYCAKCGNAISHEVKSDDNTDYKHMDSKVKRTVIFSVIVLALVVAAIFYFGGSKTYTDYHDLIEEYFDANADMDIDRIVSLFYPDITECLSGMGYGDEYIIRKIDDYYCEYSGYNAVDWRISYIDNYDREDLYDDLAEVVEIDVINQAEAYIDVEVEVVLSSGDEEDYDFDLMQINGKWYLVSVW